MEVIEPASVEDLQLRVTTRPGGRRPAALGDVTVRSCREAHTSIPFREPVWSVEAEKEWVRLSALRYGVVPDGFKVLVPATPLHPGACYWIAHSGPEGVYVRFDGEGQGAEISWHDAMVFEGLVADTARS
jgi:hypothetical protein